MIVDPLRTLTFASGGLIASHGRIRELASMKALTLLQARVDGPT
jgi:hypothetical protein